MTSAPDPLDSPWQQLAGRYDRITGADPSLLSLCEAIVAELPSSPGRVLDLGTGTGLILGRIRALHAQSHLVGLDPAPAMIEEARRKLAGDDRVEFVIGSADRLDFPDGSFDVVVSNFALHHLTHPAKRVCAAEVFRVLAPGGRFIFGDQHLKRLGTPADPEWVEETLIHFCQKARYYLRSTGLDKMLLQVRLLPKYLLCEEEMPATVEYWLQALIDAGFVGVREVVVPPDFLLHSVIVGIREEKGG